MTRTVIFSRIAISVLLGLAFGAAISETSYYFLKNGETRPPQLVEIDIPLGTAQRVSQGIADPSLPANINFVVGDTLLVKNDDTAVHQLGPLFIPPGSSSTMQLQNVGDLSVTCSFQPSRYIGLSVQSPLTLWTRIVGVLEVGLPMGILIALYGIFAVPLKKPLAA